MASRSEASLFRSPTNSQPPRTRARTTTISTMTPDFMGVLLILRGQRVDRVNHFTDLCHIARQQGDRLDFLRFAALVAQIEQSAEGGGVDTQLFLRAVDDLALARRRRGIAMQDEGVAEENAEGRDR